ncbi:MAG: DNRLRE domain-containing protein [SAR202 cluster bacterium]|jgi:hypothetical protein|nr:DNRLRE domain-containing protein [SAR202 cluster bacterium]MDP6714168.1 DNRLRE domain-containing protein [SAR202 cluster bacterium]
MRRSFWVLAAFMLLALVVGGGIGRAQITEIQGEMRVGIVPNPVALILGGPVGKPYLPGPFFGVEPLSLEFVACCVADTSGEDVTFEWNFDYDGMAFEIDAVGPGPFAITYPSAESNKLVALRLTPETGDPVIISELVSVLEVSSDLVVVPLASAGGPYSGIVGSPVQFNATTSSDGIEYPDGVYQTNQNRVVEIEGLLYEWDFDTTAGTFVPDLGGIGLMAPTYIYDLPGGHTAALRVTDLDVDISSMTTAIVTIAPNQETVMLSPLSDSWIDRAEPDANHGIFETLRVQSDASANNRALVRFDLTSIPAGVEVDKATLHLFALQVPVEARTYGLHRVTSFWEELDVTWSSQPTGTSNYTDTADTRATPGRMDWDVTSDVDGMLSGILTNWGWLIEDANEYDINVGIGRTEYASQEHETESLWPVLEVSYHLP